MVEGSCINTTIFIYSTSHSLIRFWNKNSDEWIAATSALNILIDIFILALPIPLLLSIQRPMREKSALLAIFALGAFSCIASIVRLYSVRVFTMVRTCPHLTKSLLSQSVSAFLIVCADM
jgi:putative effector of murein hydrolase